MSATSMESSAAAVASNQTYASIFEWNDGNPNEGHACQLVDITIKSIVTFFKHLQSNANKRSLTKELVVLCPHSIDDRGTRIESYNDIDVNRLADVADILINVNKIPVLLKTCAELIECAEQFVMVCAY